MKGHRLAHSLKVKSPAALMGIACRMLPTRNHGSGPGMLASTKPYTVFRHLIKSDELFTVPNLIRLSRQQRWYNPCECANLIPAPMIFSKLSHLNFNLIHLEVRSPSS